MKLTDSVPEMGTILTHTDMQASARESDVLWRFSPGSAAAERRATPWWLWWNILSLDAPAVAVVWAALFARAEGSRLPASDAIALLLSVWIIYTSDRLLDGWTARNRAALQERHLFGERHRLALAALVFAASGIVLWLMADRTLASEAMAGVKLGVILMLYMAGIHAGRGKIARVLPKELSVGFLFAMGATLPLWSRAAGISWREILPWVFFGLLCSLNCLSIECWENHRDGAEWTQPSHPFVRWADARLNGIAAILVIAILAAHLAGKAGERSAAPLLAVCGGALLILLLNRARTKISASALRVLADAALLVPALVALAIRG
jgi:hypothetical protein